MKSFFPYGYTRFGDDRDLLTDAEAGRLVLDHSRHADGTYRRDNKGYFAELTSLQGLGFIGPGGWATVAPATDPYASTGRTPTAVGPTGPIVMPSMVVPGASDLVARGGERQTSKPGGSGLPTTVLAIGVGVVGLGLVFMAVGGKRGRRKTTRRRR
jgi:hypothetical protein